MGEQRGYQSVNPETKGKSCSPGIEGGIDASRCLLSCVPIMGLEGTSHTGGNES